MKYKFNDWMTPLDRTAVAKFAADMDHEARKRFGVDGDGDCPVQFILVDRTRYEKLHYEPVRYSHKPMSAEERVDDERILFMNLELAAGAVRRWHDEYERRCRKGPGRKKPSPQS